MARIKGIKANKLAVFVTLIMLLLALTITYHNISTSHNNKIPVKVSFFKIGTYRFYLKLDPVSAAIPVSSSGITGASQAAQVNTYGKTIFMPKYAVSILLVVVALCSVLLLRSTDASLLSSTAMAPLIARPYLDNIGDGKLTEEDKAVRQTILNGLKKSVIEPLQDIVKWDRYAIKYDVKGGFLFGWIAREDGKYDFVVINFQMNNGVLLMGYNTSSKKYSQEILKRLKGNPNSYVECRPASEIISEDEKLVDWQKVP